MNFINDDFESFVRETVQNSNDARVKAIELGLVGSDKYTQMIYQNIDLNTDERRKFLEVMDRDKIFSSHLVESELLHTFEHLSKEEIKKYYNGKSPKPLNLFAIHDFNTTGLIGVDLPQGKEESLFASLCRDSGFSKKSSSSDEASGGSYGMGKAVLWMFSKFNTVLFLSYNEHPQTEKKMYRFFGLTELGYHEINGKGYEGIGQFGIPVLNDKNISDLYSKSYWVESISELSFLPNKILDERKGKRGTTIILVGTHEFSRLNDIETQKTHQYSLAEEFYKWYWPLIILGKLDVSLQFNNRTINICDEDSPADIKPFISIFKTILDSENEDFGDQIIHKSINTSTPRPLKEGNSNKVTSRADVFYQFIDDFEHLFAKGKSPKYKNHIAWMRGANSIVKYKKVPNPGASSPYFGIVLAGEACQHIDPEFKGGNYTYLENFLKYAEPPAHNDWESKHSQLKKIYGTNRGAVGALSAILKEFRDVKPLLRKKKVSSDARIISDFTSMFTGTYQGLTQTRVKGNSTSSGNKKQKSGRLTIEIIKNPIRSKDKIIFYLNVSRSGKTSEWQFEVIPIVLDEFGNQISKIDTNIVLKCDGYESIGSKTRKLGDQNYGLIVEISKIPKIYNNSTIELKIKEIR